RTQKNIQTPTQQNQIRPVNMNIPANNLPYSA
ncbi:hypothetical protein SAMN05880582_104273, partial [Rhizobium sp. RU20A]